MEKPSKRIGFIVPSSNTVLEPSTSAMVSANREISLHFTRLVVTEISLKRDGLSQFEASKIVEAARLLAHAKVDMIAWNGTSGSWLGLQHDIDLCRNITLETGTPATTSTLAFHAVFRDWGVRRVALVTPYTREVQRQVVQVWGEAGIECVAERHLGLAENYAFGDVSEAAIAAMVREVSASGCEAIAIVCTNMRGARLAPRLELELEVPVLDSVSVTLRACMDAVGASCAPISDWGCVFGDDQTPVHSQR